MTELWWTLYGLILGYGSGSLITWLLLCHGASPGKLRLARLEQDILYLHSYIRDLEVYLLEKHPTHANDKEDHV